MQHAPVEDVQEPAVKTSSIFHHNEGRQHAPVEDVQEPAVKTSSIFNHNEGMQHVPVEDVQEGPAAQTPSIFQQREACSTLLWKMSRNMQYKNMIIMPFVHTAPSLYFRLSVLVRSSTFKPVNLHLV
jgi:hypothetical protein